MKKQQLIEIIKKYGYKSDNSPVGKVEENLKDVETLTEDECEKVMWLENHVLTGTQGAMLGKKGIQKSIWNTIGHVLSQR